MPAFAGMTDAKTGVLDVTLCRGQSDEKIRAPNVWHGSAAGAGYERKKVMSDRDQRMRFVYGRAAWLTARGRTETFAALASSLNREGFTISYGTPYQGGRGVARLVSATYAYARDELGLGDTEPPVIAEAYTNKDGEYPYE